MAIARIVSGVFDPQGFQQFVDDMETQDTNVGKEVSIAEAECK